MTNGNKKNKLGNPNIAEAGKKYRWKEGQSGNPNGRPPSRLKKVFKAMDSQGIGEATNSEILAMMRKILDMKEDEQRALLKDKDFPMFWKNIIRKVQGNDIALIDKILSNLLGQDEKAGQLMNTSVTFNIQPPKEEENKK